MWNCDILCPFSIYGLERSEPMTVDVTYWLQLAMDRKWTTTWDPSLTMQCTVYPKKYAHGFCFAVLCCGYTWTDFPISIRLTSLALGQSNDYPSASKATLMDMDKYFMWIHYEWLHNHNKAKHNKTVCIFLGIYCIYHQTPNIRRTKNENLNISCLTSLVQNQIW